MEYFNYRIKMNLVFYVFYTLNSFPWTSCLGVHNATIGQRLPQLFNGPINNTEATNLKKSEDFSDVSKSLFDRPRPRPTSLPSNMKTMPSVQKQDSMPKTESEAISCYCNLPQCVPTGYLCPSVDIGACFSKRVLQESGSGATSSLPLSSNSRLNTFAVDTLTRGCAEMLSEPERLDCNASVTSSTFPVTSQTSYDAAPPGPNLQCCKEDLCNYELPKPIIIRQIEDREPAVSLKISWLKGITIVVAVTGIIILALLLVFAATMLTSDSKGRAPEFLQNTSRDYYVKVPYYIERTSTVNKNSEEGGEEGCSVLCVKSLQKRQDVADYCRFHPLSSSSNRHSFSCPSSLSSCSTLTPACKEAAMNEELQPLTRRGEATSSTNQKEGDDFSTNRREGDKVLPANQSKVNKKILAYQKEVLVRPMECSDQVENLLLNS